MPTREEPDLVPAESITEPETADTLSLVDLFDQIDRIAFRRALEHRDSVYPSSTSR